MMAFNVYPPMDTRSIRESSPYLRRPPDLTRTEPYTLGTPSAYRLQQGLYHDN